MHAARPRYAIVGLIGRWPLFGATQGALAGCLERRVKSCFYCNVQVRLF